MPDASSYLTQFGIISVSTTQALFFVTNIMRNQASMLTMTGVGAIFIVFSAPFSFAVGHYFLLQFLSASLLKKMDSSKVSPSSAASTIKSNNGSATGTTGTTGAMGTTQGDTQSDTTVSG